MCHGDVLERGGDKELKEEETCIVQAYRNQDGGDICRNSSADFRKACDSGVSDNEGDCAADRLI